MKQLKSKADKKYLYICSKEISENNDYRSPPANFCKKEDIIFIFLLITFILG